MGLLIQNQKHCGKLEIWFNIDQLKRYCLWKLGRAICIFASLRPKRLICPRPCDHYFTKVYYVNHRQFEPWRVDISPAFFVLADLRILKLCISNDCLILQRFPAWICPAGLPRRLLVRSNVGERHQAHRCGKLFEWFGHIVSFGRVVKRGTNYLWTSGFFHQQYYSILLCSWQEGPSLSECQLLELLCSRIQFQWRMTLQWIYCGLTLGPSTLNLKSKTSSIHMSPFNAPSIFNINMIKSPWNHCSTKVKR